MKLEDMDLAELPPTRSFVKMVDQQFYLWEAYKPTKIEKDFPFEQDWWKYIYWMPRIKKEFYVMAMSAPNFDRALIKKCQSYGMDFWFFTTHYKDFIKRLEWMRKNRQNHIGEVI